MRSLTNTTPSMPKFLEKLSLKLKLPTKRSLRKSTTSRRNKFSAPDTTMEEVSVEADTMVKAAITLVKVTTEDGADTEVVMVDTTVEASCTESALSCITSVSES